MDRAAGSVLGFVFGGMVLGVGVVLATLPRRGRGTLWRVLGDAALSLTGQGVLWRGAPGFGRVFGAHLEVVRLCGHEPAGGRASVGGEAYATAFSDGLLGHTAGLRRALPAPAQGIYPLRIPLATAWAAGCSTAFPAGLLGHAAG